MRFLMPVLWLACALSFAQSGLYQEPVQSKDYPEAKDGVVRCLSNEIWDMRAAELGLRAPGICDEGSCDDPVVRDATSTSAVTIDVIVHVMRDNNGNNGVSQSVVNDTIAQMNSDYASNGTNIQFNLVATRFHNDSTYACVTAYSPFNSTWYNEILQMRDTYNENPSEYANIYISCQDSSPWGILLGIATFPWDPAALGPRGGMWVNNIATGTGNKTPSHEMGHCLGLWHTHHGVSEVDSCSSCYELASGVNGDATGDFCSDTPPTPTNQNCSDPGGSDCQGTSWGNTQEQNIMGYAPDSCQTLLTNQQKLRMHCWSQDVLSGWYNGGGGGPTNNPPTASFTYNANNLAVSFDGTGSSDSDGTITSYAWNFGDGNNGSGSTTSHTYAAAGTYTVTLTVTDDDGATDQASQSVTVTSGGTGGTWATLSSSDFESGWQGWSDGGSDCRRSSNDSAYANGTYCVRLRDNTSSSVMTRSENLSGYTDARVSFSFYMRSMENNEDFWLQVNDGSGWSTVASYARGSGYSNNQRYNDTVTINGIGGSNVQFRFRCDASTNSDFVYIDDVVIEAR